MRSILAAIFVLAMTGAAMAQTKEQLEQQKKLDDSMKKYFDAMDSTSRLLAKVTDEESAKGAFEKLQTQYAAKKESREKFFLEFATLDLPEATLAGALERLAMRLKQSDSEIAEQHERIFRKSKPAFKVLRNSGYFKEMETRAEEQVRMQTQMIATFAKTYQTRHDGKWPADLGKLAEYAEMGKKALIDPWNMPYNFKVDTEENGRTLFYVWTVSPYTGQKIGKPPPEPKKDDKK